MHKPYINDFYNGFEILHEVGVALNLYHLFMFTGFTDPQPKAK